MRWILTSLILSPLAVVQGQDLPVRVSMPDPVQTFNLFVHFLEVGNLDGSVALTYEPGAPAKDRLRERYKRLARRAAKRGFKTSAVDQKEAQRLALVYIWDHKAGETRIDIDPGFLIRDRGAWKLLPIFSIPDGPLPYLSDGENKELQELFRHYDKTKQDLRKKLEKLGRKR